MNVIVMGGCGKVGAAVADLLKTGPGVNVYLLDKDGHYNPSQKLGYQFMHVCIPWGKDFHRDVRCTMKRYDPDFVIVHSTVPVGTTRRLGSNAVHSPVRGQHDDLMASVKRFITFVGGTAPSAVKASYEHLSSCGMIVRKWGSPEETELMKELCLSRYLNDIAFYETAYHVCKAYKVPPSRLLEWTWTYNDGYKGSRKERPECVFPYGKIGGTCVIPVSKMLFEQTKNPWLRKNLEIFKGSGIAV